MALRRNKTQLYVVIPSIRENSTRLIRGTLKEVESKLRGEYEVRVATAEETHAMADVEIEDAQGEPV